jgi:DNA-binding transcriptional MocR family regulator
MSTGAKGGVPLYERIATRLERLIERGAFRAGQRVPSIREMRRLTGASINTVMAAYARLESRGWMEARPQSGYYVSARTAEPEAGGREEAPKLAAKAVSVGETAAEVIRLTSDARLVPLGQSGPDPRLLPVERLNRMLAAESRRLSVESVCEAPAEGCRELRRAIARRTLGQGCAVAPDEVVVTSGCLEAVLLALQATCRAGDTVAIATPVFYSFLDSMAWLGLKVLEVPACPRSGVSVEVLEYAIRRHRVRACLLIPNFSNPLGSLMQEENKRALAEMVGRHGVPLIEDDVYGDLGFGPARPKTVKAYDREGLVVDTTGMCGRWGGCMPSGWRRCGRRLGGASRRARA